MSIKSISDSSLKKEGIVETKSGFTNLKISLNNWIEKKEQELDKNWKKTVNIVDKSLNNWYI